MKLVLIISSYFFKARSTELERMRTLCFNPSCVGPAENSVASICHPASLGLSTSHVVQYSVLKGGNQKKILYLPPLPANLPGQFATRDEAVEYPKATDHVNWHLTPAPNNMRKCVSHEYWITNDQSHSLKRLLTHPCSCVNVPS